MSGQKNQKGKYRNYILAITGLAVFNFLFLGTEYFFDDRMAELVPAGRVVWAQSIILTVSVAGFLVYPILKHYRGSRPRNGYADYFRSDLYVKYLDDDR